MASGDTRQSSMDAVIFDGQRKSFNRQLETTTVQHDSDIIVKVHFTALCGSDLHIYRGAEDPGSTQFVMGHEFTGVVVETGDAVQNVTVGDKIVSPFTTSCGNCFYCQHNHSSRCEKSQLFGSPNLDGAQAEFVRVPLADSTVFKAPLELSDQALILMADIFPTGYYGVISAMAMVAFENANEAVMVIVGCGPVGLCAVACAQYFGFRKVFAVDGVESRLKLAEQLGATPLTLEHGTPLLQESIGRVTSGHGADMVVEAVGMSDALQTAYDLVRPFGAICSIGVHNGPIPWSGAKGYDKNLRLQMGRCPVRSVFSDALAVLKEVENKLGFMFENEMPLSEAPKAYELFEQRKVQKVIFRP